MSEPTARDPEAQERIATLIEERDKAREEAGHEKAMRRFCGEERDRFIRETMRLKDELAAALSPQPEADDDTLADIQQAATGGPDFTVATWPQPEAAGEAGLRAALTELIQTWRERANTSFHAHAWSDAVTELEAALAAPALPEPGERT